MYNQTDTEIQTNRLVDRHTGSQPDRQTHFDIDLLNGLMYISEHDHHSDGGVRCFGNDRPRWEGPSGGIHHHGWAHQDLV